MKRSIRNTAAGAVLLCACIVCVGCDLFEWHERSTATIAQNSLDLEDVDGKELDLMILRNLFPGGITETLEDQRTAARGAHPRSVYIHTSYFDDIGTPAETYGESSGVLRVPAEGLDERFLHAIQADPSDHGYFLTIEEVSDEVFKVVFTTVKELISSVDHIETTFYAGADDWEAYDSAALTEKGWASERVYYRDDTIMADRTSIARWYGDEAKGAFMAPDYSPFSPEEQDLRVDALFTINIGRLYSENSNNDLDYYFNRFWDQSHIDHSPDDYSSFTRSFDFHTADTDRPGFTYSREDALTEQNDYYTETATTSYPAILQIPEGTPGRMAAGISYYLSLEDEDPDQIVNAHAIYRDSSGDFLMKDVKTLERSPHSDDYPYLHRHYQLYYLDGQLTYHNQLYYFRSDDLIAVRTAGTENCDTYVSFMMNDRFGYWEGLYRMRVKEVTGDREIVLNSRLVNRYLHYQAFFNGTLYEIIPDTDGNLYFQLPGGGVFSGRVSSAGVLSGVYTASDGSQHELH
jgi:hypothetical protein